MHVRSVLILVHRAGPTAARIDINAPSARASWATAGRGARMRMCSELSRL